MTTGAVWLWCVAGCLVSWVAVAWLVAHVVAMV
jgi:hypothetical protein